MKEVSAEQYTGFGSCKSLVEFERDLRMKKITRRNRVSQDIEVILRPKEFMGHIMALRSQLSGHNRVD